MAESTTTRHGQFKWYNVRKGYGFIQDLQMRTDVFVHASGLARYLRSHPPREGDKVMFSTHQGNKGLEARNVRSEGAENPRSNTAISRPSTSRRMSPESVIQAKIYACIQTAKAIAENTDHRLQHLIPLLLQHNGLPSISIPRSAFLQKRQPKWKPTTVRPTQSADEDAEQIESGAEEDSDEATEGEVEKEESAAEESEDSGEDITAEQEEPEVRFRASPAKCNLRKRGKERSSTSPIYVPPPKASRRRSPILEDKRLQSPLLQDDSEPRLLLQKSSPAKKYSNKNKK